MKRITTHLATPLLLSLALCLFTGCSGNSDKATAKVSDETTTTPTTPADTQTAAVTPDTAAAPEAPTPETAPGENTEPSPAPTTGSGGLVAHEADEERLSVILDLIAQDLEAQKLAYVSDLGQDCSGIYHKIKDQLQRKMSELGDKSKYHYPTYAEDRDSRAVAKWYHSNNNLYIVRDALADGNKIRPGTVMFYGQTDKQYNNPSIDELTTRGVGIMHIAVVTKVETDDAGKVTKYTIMHGRNTKYTASRTGGNCDCGGSTAKQHAKFPFGNWNQPWVAMANIETPL